MSRPRTANPDDILNAAADLFASRPFHEVRLEDIAARAHVGKGTVYLHWESKEAVYLAIIRRGLAAVVERVERELRSGPAETWTRIAAIIDAMIDFAHAYPGVYRIMRSGSMTPEDADLQHQRARLVDRIVGVLRDGVASGELNDPAPELTAQYILSFVRGALLYPPPGLTPRMLRDHILHVLRRGIGNDSGGVR